MTEIVQFSPAPRVEPQVLAVMGNSEAWAPVTEMLEIVIVVPPVFVRVAILGWLEEPMAMMPHDNFVGVRVALPPVNGP